MANRRFLVACWLTAATACTKAGAPAAPEATAAVAPAPLPSALAAASPPPAPLPAAASPVAVAAPPVVPTSKFVEVGARGSHFAAKWLFAPPKVGELFAVDITLTDLNGRPLPEAKVAIDATMPAHGHGMMTDPELKQLGPTQWHAEGLKFHMHGAWQFEVRVESAGVKEKLRAGYEQPPQATDGL